MVWIVPYRFVPFTLFAYKLDQTRPAEPIFRVLFVDGVMLTFGCQEVVAELKTIFAYEPITKPEPFAKAAVAALLERIKIVSFDVMIVELTTNVLPTV